MRACLSNKFKTEKWSKANRKVITKTTTIQDPARTTAERRRTKKKEQQQKDLTASGKKTLIGFYFSMRNMARRSFSTLPAPPPTATHQAPYPLTAKLINIKSNYDSWLRCHCRWCFCYCGFAENVFPLVSGLEE